MNILKQAAAPRYQRNGVTSYLLISEQTCGSQMLTVSLVEMQPGGVQPVHCHEPEQMYYILEGTGLMIVDGERQVVQAGDCVYFRSCAEHGLKNTGENVLRYISAAAPAFTQEETERLWPIRKLMAAPLRAIAARG